MSTEEKSLYHCERCNELFSAPIRSGRSVVCTICYQPPVSNKNFNSMDGLETVEVDDKHGVPGEDVADFVSMQKVRRKKNVQIAFVLWILVLCVAGGVAVYFRDQQQDDEKLATVGSEIFGEEAQRKQREQQARLECLYAFNRFLTSPDINTRSETVVDGVSKLLRMEDYYSGHTHYKSVGQVSMEQYELDEDGVYPQFTALVEDENKRRVEVVFWKKSDSWLIDWEQFVRYSDANWSEFLFDREVNSEGSFRLYVRRRHVDKDNPSDKLQLLFYQPKIGGGSRVVESPQVEVARYLPEGKKLLAGFERLAVDRKAENRPLLGQDDAPGMLRVQVDLGFRQQGDDVVLVLEKLHAVDWHSLRASESEEAE